MNQSLATLTQSALVSIEAKRQRIDEVVNKQVLKLLQIERLDVVFGVVGEVRAELIGA